MSRDFQIDKAAFEAWLASQPETRTFDAGDPHLCPLAHYLSETLHGPVAVTGELAHLGGEEYALPAWATHFVDYVDLFAEGPFGPATALEFLDESECYEEDEDYNA